MIFQLTQITRVLLTKLDLTYSYLDRIQLTRVLRITFKCAKCLRRQVKLKLGAAVEAEPKQRPLTEEEEAMLEAAPESVVLKNGGDRMFRLEMARMVDTSHYRWHAWEHDMIARRLFDPIVSTVVIFKR